MTTLKTFSKSEDAYALATLLSSEGIDAVVVDDSSLGGNLLGATANAIRIEVPEDQFESAKNVIDDRPEPEAGLAEVAIANRRWSTTWYFDALVIIDLILLGLNFLTPKVFAITPTVDVEEFLISIAYSEDLWMLVYDTMWGFFAISIAASLMILFRLKLGRILYVGTLIWGATTFLFVPPDILSPFGNFLDMIWNLITGMIVAMMFLSPVREEFHKRLTDPR